MIKLFIIGNLGKDAIVNTLQSGKSVINFSCAHTESFKDANGNKKEKTTWVDCAWWTDSHAIVPYLKKGTKVFLEGQPDIKTFNKQDGSTGAALSLRVLACQLLGGNNTNNSNEEPSKQAPAQNSAPSQQAPYNTATLEGTEEDLPF